jgi:hypothetical protein
MLARKSLQIGTCAPGVRQCRDSSALYADRVGNHENPNGNAIRAAATAAQCWRLNQLGLLEIREEPGEPIARDTVKELLADAVREGLWQPQARGAKG